ncbi:MAG: hypothetical protein RL660_1552 [Bacteroidota bacterium]|jgi:gliding motility-associated-like protein
MRLKYCFVLIFCCACTFVADAQSTILYEESFENVNNFSNWNLNDAFGLNASAANTWVIDNLEGGAALNACQTNGTDNTLHITDNIGFAGATYSNGALAETHKRCITPIINTTGASNCMLSFLYLENGYGSQDNFTVEYSIDNGSTWLALADPPKSNIGNCGSTYSWSWLRYPLPASCNNISTLKIAFLWQNTSVLILPNTPSIALNDITVSGLTNSCTSNQLVLNTGYDDILNTDLPVGSQDSDWLVTSVLSSYIPSGFTLPYNPFTTTGNSGGLYMQSDRGKFLSHSNNNCGVGQGSAGPLDSKYVIERKFTTTQDDSFSVNMNFAVDNYINNFSIDGVTYLANAPTNQTTQFTDLHLGLYHHKIWLPAGCHVVTCSYSDWNDSFVTTSGCSGVYVEGDIRSASGVPCVLKNTCVNNFVATVYDTICQGQSYAGHTTTGVYSDTFVNAYGCDSVRNLNLTVSPAPTLSVVAQPISATVCFGNTVALNALGTDNYTWSSGIIDGTPFLPLSSNVYTLTATNSYGCTATSSVAVNVLQATNTNINFAICQGESYAGYNTAGIYIDTFSNQYGCDSIRTLTLTIAQPAHLILYDTICQGNNSYGYSTSGVYVDSFLQVSGCDSVRTLHLHVIPASNIVDDVTICEGDVFEGHTTSGVYIENYVNIYGCDSTRTLNLVVAKKFYVDSSVTLCYGDTLHIGPFYYVLPGTYLHTFVSSAGCDSVVKLNVAFVPKPVVQITAPQGFCEGDSAQLRVGNFAVYQWSTGDTSQFIQVTQGGTFQITVFDYALCTATDEITLEKWELPDVQLYPSSPNNCLNDWAVVNAIGAIKYDWYINDNLIGLGKPSNFPFKITSSPSFVTAVGYDAHQCKSEDSISVFATDCCGNVFMANAFTPNGDNLNERFSVRTDATKLETFSFSIYNRWGNRVFTTEDLTQSWDGTINGIPCDQDTYYYIIRTKCFDGEEKLSKGEVVLMR